jgi:integrase
VQEGASASFEHLPLVCPKTEDIVKFSNASIRALALPAGQSDKTYFDDTLPAFGVRVRRSGLKSFVVQYKTGGQNRRLVFGPVTSVSLDKARATAKTALAKIRLGSDPHGDRLEAHSNARHTFGTMLVTFLNRQRSRLKPRSYLEVERHLTIQCKALHARPINNIDRRLLALHLSELAESSGPGAANRCRASLSSLFTWAAKEGLAESNPVAFTNKAVEKGERKHVISDAELAKIWRALGDDDYGTIVKLLMLTGTRRDEIGSLRWSEIDFEAATIELPPERTKSEREFVVPLPPAAVAILKARPRQEDRDVVFGSGPNGFRDWSGSKAELNAKLDGVAPWVLHDFRRSLSTTAHERFEIMPHVVEALLGHVSGHQGGVAGRYNKSAYIDLRRRALERWADHIAGLVGERPAGKVIRLR